MDGFFWNCMNLSLGISFFGVKIGFLWSLFVYCCYVVNL